MSSSLDLKCITWNVRGLHSMARRHKIHAYLMRRGAHIAFLQETHLTQSEGRALQRRWRGQLYYTTFSAFAWGSLIWIRARVPFQLTQQLIDPDGRYVVVVGRLNGMDVTLGSIYDPNVEQAAFLERLSRQLAPCLTGPTLLGGDFNPIADVLLDRSHPPLPEAPTHRLSKVRREWQSNWGLIDTW